VTAARGASGARRQSAVSPSWRTRNARAADLAAEDLTPTCGRCGDLAAMGELRCASCGSRLTLEGAYARA